MFKCGILKHVLLYKNKYKIYTNIFSNAIAVYDKMSDFKNDIFGHLLLMSTTLDTQSSACQHPNKHMKGLGTKQEELSRSDFA